LDVEDILDVIFLDFCIGKYAIALPQIAREPAFSDMIGACGAASRFRSVSRETFSTKPRF